MKDLKEVLRLIQKIQCLCLGTSITIAILANNGYFSVHVQRTDKDYEVIYSDKFFSTDTLEHNRRKYADLYGFILDEGISLGYVLTNETFAKGVQKDCCEAGYQQLIKEGYQAG